MEILCVFATESAVAYSIGTAFYIKFSQKTFTDFSRQQTIRGIRHTQNFWITAGDDKLLKFQSINQEGNSLKTDFQIRHNKKISSLDLQQDILLFADKTGQVFKIDLNKLQSGRSHQISCVQFAMGHQSSITSLIISQNILITTDKDLRIKISNFPQTFVIQKVLLGHQSAILSAVEVGGFIFSSDQSSVLKRWEGNRVDSVRCHEKIWLITDGERLVGVGETQYYDVNTRNLQLVSLEYPVRGKIAFCGTRLLQVTENEVVFLSQIKNSFQRC